MYQPVASLTERGGEHNMLIWEMKKDITTDPIDIERTAAY